MAENNPLRLTAGMLTALGAMAMLGPFGTDTHLPALPTISEDFDVPASRAQLTIASFTVGQALGQYVLGSLSDRLGRKLIIVGGGVIMALTALLAAFSPSIEILVLLCLIMGFSAAGGAVVGRAVIADLVQGEKAARPFAILNMLLSVGPIIAPVIGVILLPLSGWRSIFILLALLATLSTLGVALLVPETLQPTKKQQGGFTAILKTSARVLTNRQFLYYAMILWFGFGFLFAYISSSAFIIQNVLALSPAVNAASFALNGASVIVTSLLTAKYSRRNMTKRFLAVGAILQVTSIGLLIFIVFSGQYSPWLVLIALFFITTPMGFIFGPATALALLEVRFAIGTASALLGSFQFLIAAITAAAVGLVAENPVAGLLIVGSIMIAFALIALWLSYRHDRNKIGNGLTQV